MYEQANKTITGGLSLGARIALGSVVGLCGVGMILIAGSSPSPVFYVGFGAFCLLITIACFTRGRARQFVGSLIGTLIFLAGIAYLLHEVYAGPYLSGSRSKPSVFNAVLYLIFIGIPGVTYAYKARFGFVRREEDSGELGPPPTKEQVILRAYALKAQVIHAMGIPPPEAMAKLRERWGAEEYQKFVADVETLSSGAIAGLKASGVWDEMTLGEREFLGKNPAKATDQERINASWCTESCSVLLWALQLLPEMGSYGDEAGLETIGVLVQDVAQTMKQAALRSPEEIENQRGLAELWHWRSRTRQLEEGGGTPPSSLGFQSFDEIVRLSARELAKSSDIETVDEDFAVHGKAFRSLTEAEWHHVQSVTMERHKALNWLCGYAPGNRWDETPTDT